MYMVMAKHCSYHGVDSLNCTPDCNPAIVPDNDEDSAEDEEAPAAYARVTVDIPEQYQDKLADLCREIGGRVLTTDGHRKSASKASGRRKGRK